MTHSLLVRLTKRSTDSTGPLAFVDASVNAKLRYAFSELTSPLGVAAATSDPIDLESHHDAREMAAINNSVHQHQVLFFTTHLLESCRTLT